MRGGRMVKGGTKVEFRKDGNTNCLTGVPEDNLFLGKWMPLKVKRTNRAKQIRKKNRKKGIDYSPYREKEFVAQKDGKTNAILAQGHQDNLITNLHCIRKLTPLECERLQGFPDCWTMHGIRDKEKITLSDTRRYQLLGNAVSVPVVNIVGLKLIESMTNKKTAFKIDDREKNILKSKALRFQLLLSAS